MSSGKHAAAGVGRALMLLLSMAPYRLQMFFAARAPFRWIRRAGTPSDGLHVRLGNGRAIGKARVNVFVEVLQEVMQILNPPPPPEPLRRRIGFHQS